MDLSSILEWLESNQEVIEKLGDFSLLILAITVVALPLVVAKLPADYFVKEKREVSWRNRKYPLFWGGMTILKNLVGVVLILVGVAMLVLPGQGALTILVGLSQTNFPGKYKLLQRIVQQESVFKSLNKIRSFAKKPPFEMPPQ